MERSSANLKSKKSSSIRVITLSHRKGDYFFVLAKLMDRIGHYIELRTLKS
jgi:hypothetical protein